MLLTAFALWAGLSHSRFLFFLGLIVTPILAPRLHLFPRYERERDKPWFNAAIMAAIVGLSIDSLPSVGKHPATEGGRNLSHGGAGVYATAPYQWESDLLTSTGGAGTWNGTRRS